MTAVPRAPSAGWSGQLLAVLVLIVGALIGAASSPTATAAVIGTQRVVVLPVTFADAPTQPWTLDQINAAMSTNPVNVAGYFAASSDGQFSFSIDVKPYAALPDATTGCDFSRWLTDALAANGDLSGYDHVVLLFGHTSQCAWGGLAYEPGVYSWINGLLTLSDGTLSVQTIAHELGHNLGLGEANGPNGQNQGDPYTVMGFAASRLFTGREREELGWLTATAIGPGSWDLTPLDSGTGQRLLSFPRGDGTSIEIDYRTTSGAYDTNIGLAVTLHIVNSSTPDTRIVDTAGQGFISGYPLALGASWQDPVSGMWFTTTARTNAGATVLVSAVAPPPTTTTTTTTSTTTTRPPVTTTTRPKHKATPR